MCDDRNEFEKIYPANPRWNAIGKANHDEKWKVWQEALAFDRTRITTEQDGEATLMDDFAEKHKLYGDDPNADTWKQIAFEKERIIVRQGQIIMELRNSASLAAYGAPDPTPTFQSRVAPWMQACFGPAISADTVERNHRFLEEALELVQACGATREECLQLVDYVYGRPVGEHSQEVGGVMVTLAALCLAGDLDMHQAGETELARIWTKVEQIRAKQAGKPKGSVVPETPSAEAGIQPVLKVEATGSTE